jgi:hypothetical protein
VLVSILLMAVLGKGHLVLGKVMDFIQAVSQVVGLTFFRVVNMDIRFKVKLRVETIIGEERGKAGHLGGMVIGSEFSYGEELGPVVLLVVHICP